MAVGDAADDRPLPARRADRGQPATSPPPAPPASRCWCSPSLFNCFNARSETTSAFRAPVRQPVAVGRDRTVGCCCRWRSSTSASSTSPSARRRWRCDQWVCAPPWPASCCGSANCASWCVARRFRQIRGRSADHALTRVDGRSGRRSRYTSRRTAAAGDAMPRQAVARAREDRCRASSRRRARCFVSYDRRRTARLDLIAP